MNLDTFKEIATSKFARQALIAQKHSPKILFAAGVVGVVGTVVLACRATLKVDAALDELDAIKGNLEIAVRNSEITEDVFDKETSKLKIKTALDIVKPFLLPLGLGIISIGALTGSHVILTKRNSAAFAAYAAVDRAYKEYRQRVATEYGDDVDKKFAMGAETVAVEEKTADGKTKMTTKDVVTRASGGRSPYAALFDEKSTHFTRTPSGNANILDIKQSWANEKLRAKGHLFLNEVHDFLDLPRTKAGSVVGWVFDPKNDDHDGDNYVSFGIFENEAEMVSDFIDGNYNGGIWLDFNVDGIIYDKI